MAVSVVSSPPVSPFVLSASYPAIIEMSSTVWGGSGITQFRYVAEVSGLIALGTKYTVPSVAYSSTGYFDIKELAKLLLDLSAYQWNGGATGTVPITQLTSSLQQANYVQWSFQVVIKEQYYNAGVFTSNTGPTLTFVGARGWTDKADSEWSYANHCQLPKLSGITNFMTYSGTGWQVLAIKATDPNWTAVGTHPYLLIETAFNPSLGGISQNFIRDSGGYQGVVYYPLRRLGYTDDATFTGVTVKVYTAANALGSGKILVDTYTIEKTVDPCEDEYLVMFKDRFYQWSFLSFTKHRIDTVNTSPQSAESSIGRFRYNVKSSDTLTLNTDWLPDETNYLMRDLVVTDDCYLVDPDDGSLEKLTVEQNSLRVKTSLTDGLHQYQMQFRKSLDNFRP